MKLSLYGLKQALDSYTESIKVLEGNYINHGICYSGEPLVLGGTWALDG